jgi:hypothetical protein
MEWILKNSSRPKKARVSKSKIKTMLICFFDIRCIIHFESVPKETTANNTFYMNVFRSLIDAMGNKQGQLWRDCSSILYHDSVSAHSSLQVSQFLAGRSTSTVDHPLYSPDLAPADLTGCFQVFLKH